ncbi:unannotated protein [freshwater metagenome]|uniref:Unannotated protein n=1 Tax=freshwater metagenome TaxID=449393 RepID=A0A6J6VDU3_9ZZZZ
MNTVAFATGQIANALLLVRALEVEAGHICAAMNFAVAYLQRFCAVGDFFVHRLVGVQGVAALVDIAHLHGVTNGDGAAVWCFLARQHIEQRCLTCAVRADDANNARWRK